jgi:hypothetical protein
MYADASHGGLRPKRGLTAEFHTITAHYRLIPKTGTTLCTPIRSLGIPKSRQTIVTARKRANSRFFTDCYPISAAFAPRLNQIPNRLDTILVAPSDHGIHN